MKDYSSAVPGEQSAPTQSGGTHTPEPWHVGKGRSAEIVYAQDGWAVANATVFHARHATHDAAIDHQHANARRIVACVNACAGLSTSALESYPGMFLRIVETAEQRDEFAEALRNAMVWVNFYHDDVADEMRRVAADLLAKVTVRTS